MAPYVRRKNLVVAALAGLVAGCIASVTSMTPIKNLRDPRIALYRPKHLRHVEEYHSAVLRVLVASKAHLQTFGACEALQVGPRTLRRRANAVKGLPCAVSVHHGFECLKCALQAARNSTKSRIFVESILLPAATYAHLLPDLPPWTKVYSIEDPGLLKRLFRSASDASADAELRYGCRYTVAWPSVALEELSPPLLVLDGLTSATNLGQLFRTARCLGVTSFVVPDCSWSAFNGRLAAVSEGQAYFCDVHYASKKCGGVLGALRCLRERPVRLFAAEEFCDQKVSEVSINDRNWALVLGSEDRGVTPEALELCEGLRVPQERGQCLNVAATGAICLYELCKASEIRDLQSQSPK